MLGEGSKVLLWSRSGKVSIIASNPTKVGFTSSVSLKVISVRAAISSEVSTLIVLLCLSIVLLYDFKGASVS